MSSLLAEQTNVTVLLSEIRESGWVVIRKVSGDRPHAKRLSEMGLIAGARAHVKSDGAHGPMIIVLGSSRLALDRKLAAEVQVACTGP